GMFLAIVLPPFRHEKPVRVVVLLSAGMSCLLSYVPVFSFITGGFRIIVCAVIASALAAWLMPTKEEKTEETA
ncbi:MAG: branched-chain amino acid ABC transporter permease, partial [Eubacteriales bacterium]|nr:branched-chain amino acid ABC transporter permease [Eubacteriales bacterium]